MGITSEPFYVPFNEITPLKTTRGMPAVFIWQAFPWLKNFYTDYEMNYQGVPDLQDYTRQHWAIPLIACALYALMIFGGRHIMCKRPAFDLKNPLAAWNLFLAAFSFLGMIRTVPYLFYWMTQLTFREINCTDPSFTHGDRDVGFWTMLFAASKFFELIDTLFIILRKKPLIFLHWYHHLTVLCFTYYSCAFRHAGLFFVAMNYSVHSIMYLYFWLMAIKGVPKWFNSLWITMAQISQMFVGVFVTLSTAYFKLQSDNSCPGAQTPLLIGSLMMYGSYFYLFVEFAVMRFIIAPRRRAAKLAAAATASKEGGKGKGKQEKEDTAIGSKKAGVKPVVVSQGEEEEVPIPRLIKQSSSYSLKFTMEKKDPDEEEEEEEVGKQVPQVASTEGEGDVDMKKKRQ